MHRRNQKQPSKQINESKPPLMPYFFRIRIRSSVWIGGTQGQDEANKHYMDIQCLRGVYFIQIYILLHIEKTSDMPAGLQKNCMSCATNIFWTLRKLLIQENPRNTQKTAYLRKAKM